MLIATLGIVLAFNLIIIYVKLRYKRYGDAALDAAALVTLAIVFGGSSQSLAVATIASALISIFLYFVPPNKLIQDNNDVPNQDAFSRNL